MSFAGDSVPEIGVDALHARLQAGEQIQVIDVREPWEWAQGHIAGATHIPLQSLPERLGEIDATREAAFVCHLGGRSEMATRFVLRRGLDRAANVAGGMDAWEARGLPVER